MNILAASALALLAACTDGDVETFATELAPASAPSAAAST